MDQFEAARLKTAQREARKIRYETVTAVSNDVPDVPSVADVPQIFKEKPKKDGRFTVMVDMPHTTFSFTLVKSSILSNVPASKLTENEIRKHIIQGLRPLLGGVE